MSAEIELNLRALREKVYTLQAERDRALDALRVILLTPRTRDWLRDNDPKALVQAASAVPVYTFAKIDLPTGDAIRELSRIVRIIEQNPPSRRKF